jgi:hypothetical protein
VEQGRSDRNSAGASLSAIEDVEATPGRRALAFGGLWLLVCFLGIAATAGLIWAAKGLGLTTGRGAILVGAWLVACVLPGTKTYAMFPIMMVVAPLVVLQSRFAFPGKVERIERPPTEVPAESVRVLDDYRRSLMALGFASEGTLLITGPSFSRLQGRADRGVLEVFRNGAGRTAVVMLALGSLPPAANPPTLRFKDRMRAGTWIVTHNTRGAGLFPHTDDHHAVALPGETDAARLFRVHEAMIRRFAPALALKPTAPAGWEQELLEENLECRELWLKHHFIEEAEGPGEYRIARARVLPVAWGFVFPVKNWREAAMRRRNRMLVDELAV